ncbi:uncharacterized protein BCR38DRAFT_501247 [Pseudomassariella vexata]|uniref:PRISE-like Rossmann-fold domain-containing protein n=1 Tax=Pseudomassariella vexata TaxID=1141098 RepID=A0A1Y2DEP0_9PEZI|nr:uncharacterized protein BCR38DRAFT_501247 [Pseudomassariella vexata]ORY57731.1 hypothetical protein BCR38DRAFT_501247 [Pseudomassariella vexata]
MAGSTNHAIVFGASGLIGWSVVYQLLSRYPESGAFSKVTAVTNRPVDISDSYWPELSTEQPDLQLVSGIDLRGGDGDTLADTLKQSIKCIESVTHVFYFAFTSVNDDIEEVATNRAMLKNVIDAINLLSAELQFVVFPGGTRGYGIYIPGGTFKAPLTEEMTSNLPEDYAKTVVYRAFREILAEASKGKKWTWCEVCPDAIVGFTPNGSQFSLALHWAQYLSLYAYNHGVGSRACGMNQASDVDSLSTPVSAKTIAQFAIYASLHPDNCGRGQLFNIGDKEKPCTMGEIWPKLAQWFCLVGVGPRKNATDQEAEAEKPSKPGEYVEKHNDVFHRAGLDRAARAGVGAGSQQLDSVGWWLTFDRQLSLKRLRDTGFREDKDPLEGWLKSFEMFRRAGLIL